MKNILLDVDNGLDKTNGDGGEKISVPYFSIKGDG